MKKIILAILLIFYCSIANAGTSLQGLSETMTIIEADRIREVVLAAKKSSQRSLSKEELAKMLKNAEDVLDGAMIFTHSEIIR